MSRKCERPAGTNHQALREHRQAEQQDDDRSVAPDHETRAALEEARARWGSRAMVEEVRTLGADGRHETAHCVGRQHDAHSWDAIGIGSTWREAFAAADRTEGRA